MKHQKLTLFILLSMTLSVLTACPRPMPAYCSEYYGLSREKRDERIASSSTEELFNLELCAYYAEPGDGRISSAIADQGDKNIPFLLSKLKKENDDHTKETAISLLSLMDSSGKLTNRAEVISIIEKTIPEIKDADFRRFANNRLRKMKGEDIFATPAEK